MWYYYSLPHSLIIAQTFGLNFQDYGNDFGVSEITGVVEYIEIIKKSNIVNLNKKFDLEGLKEL